MRQEADKLRRDIVQYNILELATKLEDFVSRLKSLATEVCTHNTCLQKLTYCTCVWVSLKIESEV